MRMCQCGKANLPTRKFCVRCGKSLLKPVEPEKPPSPVVEQPAIQSSVTPEMVKPPAPSEPPKPTTEDKWVRPSEVAKDRVRTSAPKPKSEMEKAREAFARAEQVGIEEAGEGIVETRMLRASEVRELLDSMADLAEQAEAEPPGETAYAPGAPDTQMPATPVIPSTQDIEEGILGSRSSLVEKPEPAPTAEPSIAPASHPPVPSAPTSPTETAPSVHPPEMSAQLSPSVPIPEPVVEAPAIVEIPEVIPEVKMVEMKIHDSEYLKDDTITTALSDLKVLHIEKIQVEAELKNVQVRHDIEVQNYRNVAEVKRIRFESLQEQTRHAKAEWNDAEKQFKKSEDRRKNEIQSREKRIDKVKKQISKSEGSIDKRVRELDKRKERMAQFEKT
ncbi:MAG: hypothetical protein ACFE7R_11350 [Candidatus Hodarchaeota archaeon]